MDSQNGAETISAAEPLPPVPPRPIGFQAPSGLVELYLEYSKDIPSPYVFRLWTALHAIGAAAERRVWTQLGINRLHPNLFVFLVGPPGTGKSQAINPMSMLLRKSQAVGIAPNDISKQGLLDALGENAKGALIEGRPFDYHFLALCISELSNFMSKYDNELAGILTDLFDCPPMNEEKKRTHNKGAAIPFPGISFIMGTATENLGNTIAEDMWGSGFMARVIMVYSADEIIPEDMFAVAQSNESLENELVTGLRRLGEKAGPMIWTPAARILLAQFRINQKEGAPLHNRLTFYVVRRWLHLGKLCMISALSDERMEVEENDVLTAMGWLTAAEVNMPEIFKDMARHEDGQIYEELRNWMWIEQLRSGGAVPVHDIYKFLSKRASTHTVPRIIEIAIASDYIRRTAGTSGDDATYRASSPDGTKSIGFI